MNTVTFTPAALTINEKTFPAAYSLEAHAVRIIATVTENGAEKPVVIEVPETDPNYMLAYAVADETARLADSLQHDAAPEVDAAPPADEAPAADPADERRETISNPETEEKEEEQTMKNAVIIVPVNEETSCLEPKRPTPTAETVTEAAPAVTDERRETISNPEAEEVAPAHDPKAARGPVPEKDFVNETIRGAGWCIVFDEYNQRTRVVCIEEVKPIAQPIIEKAGFYYSHALNSWNKKLTHRAHRAALALADQLNAAIA